MTANKNMLEHGIAIIVPGTYSVLQETRQIVIQYYVVGRELGRVIS
jgi:hypothetical protein